MGEPAHVLKTIVRGAKHPLQFPAEYEDAFGRDVLQGLLQKDPSKRLGSSESGMSVIKAHSFFVRATDKGQSTLFQSLMEFAIDPPFVPEKARSKDVDSSLEDRLSEASTQIRDSNVSTLE